MRRWDKFVVALGVFFIVIGEKNTAFAIKCYIVDGYYCVDDPSNANACQSGQRSSCDPSKGDSMYYCSGAVTPGLCTEGVEFDEYENCPNVSCGGAFTCQSKNPVMSGGAQVVCSGRPDQCS